MPNYRVISEGSFEAFAHRLEDEGYETSTGKKPTQLMSSADRYCREHAGLSEKDGGEFYQCKIGIMKQWLGVSKGKSLRAESLIESVVSGMSPKDVVAAVSTLRESEHGNHQG